MMHEIAFDTPKPPFHLHVVAPRDEPLQAARAILAARRAMNGPFAPVFIPNPVLEVLLTLFVAEADGVRLDDAALHRATTVAASTTTRWVKALIGDGMMTQTDEGYALTGRGRNTTRAAMESVLNALRTAALID